MSKPAPTAWSRLKRIGQGVFSTIGVVMTLYGAYGVVVPPSDVQQILYISFEHPLLSRSPVFPANVTVAGVDAGDHDLTETYLTLWRDGGKPIAAEMTRRPLRVSFPSGSHVIAFKVIGTDSSVPDNFIVERAGDELLVRWKVWDPDMALKVAVLRSGEPANPTLSGEVGPGVVVNRTWVRLRLQSGFVVIWVLCLSALLGLTASLFSSRSIWERRIPSPLVRNAVLIVLAGGITALGLIGLENNVQVSSWVTSKLVKPIPFTNAL